jgi:hypothetical protein
MFRAEHLLEYLSLTQRNRRTREDNCVFKSFVISVFTRYHHGDQTKNNEKCDRISERRSKGRGRGDRGVEKIT